MQSHQENFIDDLEPAELSSEDEENLQEEVEEEEEVLEEEETSEEEEEEEEARALTPENQSSEEEEFNTPTASTPTVTPARPARQNVLDQALFGRLTRSKGPAPDSPQLPVRKRKK